MKSRSASDAIDSTCLIQFISTALLPAILDLLFNPEISAGHRLAIAQLISLCDAMEEANLDTKNRTERSCYSQMKSRYDAIIDGCDSRVFVSIMLNALEFQLGKAIMQDRFKDILFTSMDLMSLWISTQRAVKEPVTLMTDARRMTDLLKLTLSLLNDTYIQTVMTQIKKEHWRQMFDHCWNIMNLGLFTKEDSLISGVILARVCEITGCLDWIDILFPQMMVPGKRLFEPKKGVCFNQYVIVCMYRGLLHTTGIFSSRNLPSTRMCDEMFLKISHMYENSTESVCQTMSLDALSDWFASAKNISSDQYITNDHISKTFRIIYNSWEDPNDGLKVSGTRKQSHSVLDTFIYDFLGKYSDIV